MGNYITQVSRIHQSLKKVPYARVFVNLFFETFFYFPLENLCFALKRAA
jgi:hypothetical protein